MTLPIFIAVVKIHIRPGSQSGLPWYSGLCFFVKWGQTWFRIEYNRQWCGFSVFLFWGDSSKPLHTTDRLSECYMDKLPCVVWSHRETTARRGFLSHFRPKHVCLQVSFRPLFWGYGDLAPLTLWQGGKRTVNKSKNKTLCPWEQVEGEQSFPTEVSCEILL